MKSNMLIKVLIAMALAVVAGSLTGVEKGFFGFPFYELYSLGGQLFLNALTLVVVPLVAASIITGTARVGSERSFGTLGLKTFGAYLGTMTLAVLTGWLIAVIVSPGIGYDVSALMPENSEVVHHLKEIGSNKSENLFATVSQIFVKLIPSNILAVAAQGQMLGLIFFSILFGLFIPKVEEGAGNVLLNFWKGIFQVMMLITHLVMRALPLGVFCLVAKIVASTGLETIKPIGYFFFTVLAALALYAFVLLPLTLKLLVDVKPTKLLRAMAPALFTAFSTSSSATALPITIECVEKRAGVSNRICSFVVPLATTLNLSGTALFNCVSVFFICQVYGLELNIGMQFFIAFLSLLTAFGIAGIPSAGIIAIIMILNTLGLPTDGVALILAVERILDMFRTTVNVLSNSSCAVYVAKSSGEYDVLSRA